MLMEDTTMKSLKKILAVALAILAIMSVSAVSAFASTATPAYQTYTYTYNGTAYTVNGKHQAAWYTGTDKTLDGYASICKPSNGTFRYIAVRAEVRSGATSTRYATNLFNKPSSGITPTKIIAKYNVQYSSSGSSLYGTITQSAVNWYTEPARHVASSSTLSNFGTIEVQMSGFNQAEYPASTNW
jgi:hypothetical protein